MIKCRWCGWTPDNGSFHDVDGDVARFDAHLKVCKKKGIEPDG